MTVFEPTQRLALAGLRGVLCIGPNPWKDPALHPDAVTGRILSIDGAPALVLGAERFAVVHPTLGDVVGLNCDLLKVWKVGDPALPKHANRQGIAVYVGRPSKWGNPFVLGVDGDRDQVIADYVNYLDERPHLIRDAKTELRGRHLVCHCAPLPCHADLLLQIANAD